MADEYKTFYLKDLVPIIEHCALDLMGSPIVSGKKADGTIMNLTEISHQNSMIAMENSGIKLLAQTLIDELKGDDADDDE
ncbi:MAG: hypothetical protein II008_14495 [Oscillospiraceae bacterium]|nr:hypothetical protein [Oscillospiraceae bacterium]